MPVESQITIILPVHRGTFAEVVDLTNTFKMGAYGIQLSEETAIGQYPMECLDVIDRIIREIDSEIK